MVTRRSFLAAARTVSAGKAAASGDVLDRGRFRKYIDRFNAVDQEAAVNFIDNARAWTFLCDNIPFFECPDSELEKTYYFRWWTYRKHIKQTPDGFVITEFLPPVPWAGKHNTISCAAGHHIAEGRWLRERKFLDDYTLFWFRKGGEPRRYSFWAATALERRADATGDRKLLVELLDDLVANYSAWEGGWTGGDGKPQQGRLGPNGLFWQIDDRDGMEISIGGSGYRATINSYMYGDAAAIARIAQTAGRSDVAKRFRAKAQTIRSLTQAKLWDARAQFYKVLPREPGAKLADVRELHGYTPWYTGLASPQQAVAWKQIMDPQGFYAPFGPTTAERRHPRFMFTNKHECLWNGPSWPFATSVTLTGLANLLNEERQEFVGKRDYFDLLRIYAKSHRRRLADGRVISWIDEDLNADTGEWIAREILHKANGPNKDRGAHYNHSTFCDLVITGLCGLRPRADNRVVVNSLLPDGSWDYYCLDRIPYHGRLLTVLYDRNGRRYGRGTGLRVFADGRQIAAGPGLDRITGTL